MALTPISMKPKQSGGEGGLLGNVAGGLLGAVGGALVGGPAGAVKGASLGSSLGGAVGGAADPAKVKGGGGVGLVAMQKDPSVQYLMLDEAKKLVESSPMVPTDEGKQLWDIYDQGQKALKWRIG